MGDTPNPATSPFNLNSKLIVLTGGASGIGLATAHLLASLGAQLSIGDLSASALESAAQSIKAQTGKDVMTMVIDVRKRDTIELWIRETLAWAGRERLDGAANLAGVIGKNHGKMSVGFAPFLFFVIGVPGDLRWFGFVFYSAVLCLGMLLCGWKWFLHCPSVIQNTEDDEWDFVMDVNLKGVMNCMRAELAVMAENGSIVNAASICGLQGLKNAGAYCASKHGVIGLSRAAAKETGEEGIRVNCVAP
ncbi:hypothetical protein BP5796_10638 [Coleophoma crateriformis]|uniref:NAD(P)-binding protein n=1 Tax=Coleophoma crateriformis TaxID=565419 RepID=A0A3D8QQP2_9HELO|nr:hypothetical protein BP5796_10638 [Coleophoma crateriformis]